MKIFNYLFYISIFAIMNTSSHALIVIPDLFGAYERGAQAAREANARDMVYSDRTQDPQIFIGVYQRNSNTPKSRLILSLADQDELCWRISPLTQGYKYQVVERFTTPGDNISFLGTTSVAFGAIQDSGRSGREYTFYRNVSVGNKQTVEYCWSFPFNAPKGRYHLDIQIGQSEIIGTDFIVN